MLFNTIRISMLALGAVLVSNGATLAGTIDSPAAKTLTITLDGTLGPVLSGNDPAGLDGKSATVTAVASESLNPYRHTAKSASYRLPVGAITVNVNGTNYTSTSKTEMMIKLTGHADMLVFKSTLKINGFSVPVLDTTSLQTGSWTAAVLQHPAVFSPSPQNLTSPSSTFKYTFSGDTTVLGVTGTASSSDAADSGIADDQLNR